MDTVSNKPSPWRTMWKEIRNDKLAFVSFIIFWTVMVSTFLLAFTIDSDYATRTILVNRNQPPSFNHLLGTDPQGRDMILMLILGARNSILVGFSITILSGFIGIVVGLLAGFYGGHTDNAIMRVIDTWSMLPFLMIVITIITIVPYYTTIHFILIFTAFAWMARARIIRAKALQQRELDYVSASKTLGTPNLVIIVREVLPNLVSVITVNMTLSLAASMGIETGLTFLGFGLPFGTPSLGTLISYASAPATMQFRMWQWLPAAILIFILMLCIYCVGQALNRAADVKQRRV